MWRTIRILVGVLCILALAAASAARSPHPGAPAAGGVPTCPYRVVSERPHDPAAFTQGLALADGVLYESTGLYGASSVRRVDPGTGQVLRRVGLPAAVFGEGLAVVGDRLVQLTWSEGKAFFWSRGALEQVAVHEYAGEGWGLAFDGRRLIMSDGSDRLTFRDPASFAETGGVSVTEGGRPVFRLNELEYAGGLVFANIWMTPQVAAIDPASGRVLFKLDLSPLWAKVGTGNPDAVPNGLAWESGTRRMLVTGKLWPTLFEIEVGECPAWP